MILLTDSTSASTADYGPIFATAALTLGAALIVGFVTAILTRRSEHAKWIREKRFEAYEEFLVRADLGGVNFGATANQFTPEQMARAYAALNGVALAGPYEMYEIGLAYQDRVHKFLTNLPGMSNAAFQNGWKKYGEDRKTFIKAAWKHLGIKDGGLK